MHVINEGYLVLHYQPKIDRDFRAFEVEALIRWHHPKNGMIQPDQLIPLVERKGLNRELLQWVLGQAIDQASIWNHKKIGIGVCINISMLDMMDLELPQILNDVLRRSSVTPSKIKLELTEAMIMADEKLTVEVLSAINELGIHTSIDDFGTGYASMGYLHKLPVHELKVDKSFIKNMVDNEHNAIIVQSIIDLAHNLSMSVVAEGVEDQVTQDMLFDFGCDSIQGYNIARPMEASKILPWLHQWNKRRQKMSLAA